MEEIIMVELMKSCLNKPQIVGRLAEGKLVVGDNKVSIEVEALNGSRYYLCHVGDRYDIEGTYTDIHGNRRIAIAKKFVETYTYDDIRLKYKAKVEEVQKKIKWANERVSKLELLCLKIGRLFESKVINQKISVRENHNLINYYIEVHSEIGDIEIHPSEEGYRCRVDYKWIDVDEKGLKKILDSYYTKLKSREKELEVERQARVNEKCKREAIDNFVVNVAKGLRVIVPLKSGFTCLKGLMRYSVGDGKEGKYLKFKSYIHLREYIVSKGINKYYVVNDSEDTHKFTNKELKTLDYKSIY